MNVPPSLQNAIVAGFRVYLDNADRLMVGPSPVPEDILREVRKEREDLQQHLRRRLYLLTLPFPMGYGGLPRQECEKAEVQCDLEGLHDEVSRKLNVYSWVMFAMLYGVKSTVPYEAIKAEYHRLKHESFPEEECGFCDPLPPLSAPTPTP